MLTSAQMDPLSFFVPKDMIVYNERYQINQYIDNADNEQVGISDPDYFKEQYNKIYRSELKYDLLTLDLSKVMPIRRYLIKFNGKIGHFFDFMPYYYRTDDNTKNAISTMENCIQNQNRTIRITFIQNNTNPKDEYERMFFVYVHLLYFMFMGYTNNQIHFEKEGLKYVISIYKEKTSRSVEEFEVSDDDITSKLEFIRKKGSITSKEKSKEAVNNTVSFLLGEIPQIKDVKNTDPGNIIGTRDENFLAELRSRKLAYIHDEINKKRILITKLSQDDDDGLISKYEKVSKQTKAGLDNSKMIKEGLKNDLNNIKSKYIEIRKKIYDLKSSIDNKLKECGQFANKLENEMQFFKTFPYILGLYEKQMQAVMDEIDKRITEDDVKQADAQKRLDNLQANAIFQSLLIDDDEN